MGKAVRAGCRRRGVLMNKIDGRSKDGAARQIEESLRRLETDHIDLLQFHEIIRPTDPDRIFAPGGAIEAAIEARQAGKIRYIGFTGHQSPPSAPEMRRSPARHQFRFRTLPKAPNVMDAHYHSFEKVVL